MTKDRTTKQIRDTPDRKIFEEVLQGFPEALAVADTVGTTTAGEPPEDAIHLYRSKMRVAFELRKVRLFALPAHGMSPIQGDILQAWLGAAGDEEIHLEEWVDSGVALGMERVIPTANIFPPGDPAEEDPLANTDLEFDIDLENYATVQENEEDTRIEIDRVIKRKFVERVEKKVVAKKYTSPAARLQLQNVHHHQGEGGRY